MSIHADSLYNLMELARQGREAFESLAAAGTWLTAAKRKVEISKDIVRHGEDALLLAHAADPRALGPNEATREAALRKITQDERMQLLADEGSLVAAQIDFDRAKLKVDSLKFRGALWRAVAALQAGGEEDMEGPQ